MDVTFPLCNRRVASAVLVWSVLVILPLTAVTGQDPVRIALRPTINTDAEVVSLGDLAQLDGGQPARRNAMSRLDIAVGDAGVSTAISRDEALARLLIAGFKPREFQLTGSHEVRVQPGKLAFDNESIVQAISRHVSQGLNFGESDVLVELISRPQVPADLPDIDPARLTLEPLDHADSLIGRKSVTLGVFDGSQLVSRLRVATRTSVFREVLVTSRPIEKNEVLNDENTHVERRLFDRPDHGQWSSTAVRGGVATRRLQAQQTIRAVDIAAAGSADPVLVRPRDLVTVVAVQGSLRITMSGMEVLRSGKAGDVIPLRNPRSKKIVFGRVIDSARIELEL